MKKVGSYMILISLVCMSLMGCSAKNSSDTQVQNVGPQDMSINSIRAKEDSLVKEEETKKKFQITEVDYSDCFENIKGCAVFYNSKANEYQIYNEELAQIETSPCSTFKIVTTLMGLENGVIKSMDSKMGYDGSTYAFEAWNKDLGLKEAFQSSCVWYFKKVIEAIGEERVKKEIDKLGYGNCDLSQWKGSDINPRADLNGFWLESSLKISPKEQVDFLANLFDGKTHFLKEHIALLKEVMLIEHHDKLLVYGKTGTGYSDNAWFVGMFEKEDENYYFAIRLNDENSNIATGPKAKEIALNIINRYYGQ